jgi:hypothetical protein
VRRKERGRGEREREREREREIVSEKATMRRGWTLVRGTCTRVVVASVWSAQSE